MKRILCLIVLLGLLLASGAAMADDTVPCFWQLEAVETASGASDRYGPAAAGSDMAPLSGLDAAAMTQAVRGVRTLSLVDDVFEFVDDGLWHVCGDFEDAEMWEYLVLRPLKPIPATFVDEDGMETAGEIAEGEAFMVTASDKTTVLWFVTEDGRTGYFGIEPNEEQGWGYLVEGMSEDELFEMVPYAD